MTSQTIIDFSGPSYPFGIVLNKPDSSKIFLRKIVPFTAQTYTLYKHKFQLLRRLQNNPNIVRLQKVLEENNKFHLLYEFVPKSLFSRNAASPAASLISSENGSDAGIIEGVKIKLIYLSACLFQNRILTQFSIQNIGVDSFNEIKYYLDIGFEIGASAGQGQAKTADGGGAKRQAVYIEQIFSLCREIEGLSSEIMGRSKTVKESTTNCKHPYSPPSITHFPHQISEDNISLYCIDADTNIKLHRQNILNKKSSELSDSQSSNRRIQMDPMRPISPITQTSSINASEARDIVIANTNPAARMFANPHNLDKSVKSLSKNSYENSANRGSRQMIKREEPVTRQRSVTSTRLKSTEANPFPTSNTSISNNLNGTNTLQLLNDIEQRLDELNNNIKKRVHPPEKLKVPTTLNHVAVGTPMTDAGKERIYRKQSYATRRKYSGDPNILSPLTRKAEIAQSPKSVRFPSRDHKNLLEKINEDAVNQENYRKESEQIKKQNAEASQAVTSFNFYEQSNGSLFINVNKKKHKASVAFSINSLAEQPSTSMIKEPPPTTYRNQYNNTRSTQKTQPNNQLHVPMSSGRPNRSKSKNSDTSDTLQRQAINKAQYPQGPNLRPKESSQTTPYNQYDDRYQSQQMEVSPEMMQNLALKRSKTHNLEETHQNRNIKSGTFQQGQSSVIKRSLIGQGQFQQHLSPNQKPVQPATNNNGAKDNRRASPHAFPVQQNTYQSFSGRKDSTNSMQHYFRSQAQAYNSPHNSQIKMQEKSTFVNPGTNWQSTTTSNAPKTNEPRVIRQPKSKNDFQQLKKNQFETYFASKVGYVQEFLGVLDDADVGGIISNKASSPNLTVPGPKQYAYQHQQQPQQQQHVSGHIKTHSRHEFVNNSNPNSTEAANYDNYCATPISSKTNAAQSSPQFKLMIQQNRPYESHNNIEQSLPASPRKPKAQQTRGNTTASLQPNQYNEEAPKKGDELKDRISRALMESDQALEKYRKLSIHSDFRSRKKTNPSN